MNTRILQGMLAGIFCAALAGAATGQIMAAMSADDPGDAKSSPTRAGGDTTPPPAPADAKSEPDGNATTAKAESGSKSTKKSASDKKTTVASSETEKPAQHAQAKSTTEKKSAHHAAKSTEDQSAKTDEKAFRQALRGCAERQDQAQRDSCLDEAIEKFQRG